MPSCHIGAEVPEKQEVAGVLAEPTPTGSSKFTFQLYLLSLTFFFLSLKAYVSSFCPFQVCCMLKEPRVL